MAGAGNGIDYSTIQQLLIVIEETSQAIAGQTFEQAIETISSGALSSVSAGGAVTAVDGSSYWSFPVMQQIGGQSIYDSTSASALEYWQEWEETAGAAGITALGAAAAGAYEWAQGVLIGTGTGTLAATAGLLTVSLPTAAAMAAPIAGVALGVELYNENPELWTKIANALVTYGEYKKKAIGAVLTKAGQLLLPKTLIDSIKALFVEEGIGVAEGKSSDLNTDPIAQPIPYAWPLVVEDETVYHVFSGGPSGICGCAFSTTGSNSYRYVIAAPTSGSFTKQLIRKTDGTVISTQTLTLGTATYDAFYTYGSAGNKEYENNAYGGNFSDASQFNSVRGNIGYTLAKGTPSGGEYPTGTSKWTGEKVDIENTPTVPVYDPSTGETTPYFPVRIPIGDPVTPGSTPQYPEYPNAPYIYPEPGTSTDPSTQPVTPYSPIAPMTPTEIPYLDPYVPPVIIPEIQLPPESTGDDYVLPLPSEFSDPVQSTDPLPQPQPQEDPTGDITIDIGRTEPTNLNPPQSTGLGPDIIFPLPSIPWPTIMPAASDTPVPSGNPGFIQVYHPTPAEMIAFGHWLWVTYADATIDKIWNNPFDGVIGAHELYATPADGGYTTIRCGFLDSGISSQLVRQRYTTINCGSMIIPEYWGNYLDYSPYSRAYIYLPFIGIQEVSVDDIVGHSVNICYHIDSYTGACIAQITVAKDGYSNTVYQFSGNCSVELPLAGGSQAAIKGAMMTADAYQHAASANAGLSLLGGLGSGLASLLGGSIGGAFGGLNQIISGVQGMNYAQAQHTAAMVSAKSTVQHSGSFGASHGAMGIKVPYIIIRRPIQKVVSGYNKLYGYPAHAQVIVGACTGYLRCREVHVISPLATEDEKTMIEDLLKTGVYVTEE